jgi:hypothetical protein
MAKNDSGKEKVVGTNCYNCKFVSAKEEPVDLKELSDVGGLIPRMMRKWREQRKLT